jgi:prepilin-type N-terminal cleavage/methylation domain-containing protein
MSPTPRYRRAFSLLELLAVVAILGIIAALVLPRVVTSSETAKEKCCLHNAAEINISVERYYIHMGLWPADNLSDIGTDPDYFPEGLPTCPVSGDAYRLDPATHRVIGHAGTSDHSP